MNEVELEKSLRKELIGEVSDDTFHKNYLIEAGAGAGKTFILSNRIVNQILQDQASPDELVAITFTEKATQEMISRIDQEISARLTAEIKEHGETSETAQKIRNLSDSIDQMQISTIHSFCHTLLMTLLFNCFINCTLSTGLITFAPLIMFLIRFTHYYHLSCQQ